MKHETASHLPGKAWSSISRVAFYGQGQVWRLSFNATSHHFVGAFWYTRTCSLVFLNCMNPEAMRRRVSREYIHVRYPQRRR